MTIANIAAQLTDDQTLVIRERKVINHDPEPTPLFTGKCEDIPLRLARYRIDDKMYVDEDGALQIIAVGVFSEEL